jgi:predicted dehydrogenase
MRFIQVGVGGMGNCWLNVLTKEPEAQLVGMVDVNDAALGAACTVGNYSKDICFHSLKQAIKHVKADAVVSVTPPRFHRNDVVTAMEAGLNVISEKPMAETMTDCKAMLRTAIKTGRTYCISQNYRYGSAMWTLSRIIRSGKLGAVGQLKMDFFLGMDFGGGFRHSMDYPLIVDMSIHHFDLIRFITGLNAISVRATSWNPKWSNYKGDCSNSVVFEMNNGAHALYNGSWCSKGQFNDWNGNWQIECEKGTAVYQNGQITVHHAKDLYKVTEVTPAKLEEPPRSSQNYVLHDFMNAVKSGGRPKTDVYDNILSIGMVLATVKAMRSGKKASVVDSDILRMLRSRSNSR